MEKIGEKFGVPFPVSEYEDRLARVRQQMVENQIEVLMVREPINVFYLTGYNTFGILNYEVLFVPQEGEVSLLVRLLEKPIAFYTSIVKDVIPWEDHEDYLSVTKDVISKKGWLNKRVAFEKGARFCSGRELEALQSKLGIALVDGSGIVENVRKIKSPAEIHYLKESARLTEIGMQAGMDHLAPGKTENEVAGKMYEAMVAGGSEFFNSQPIMTAGWKSGIPHTTFHRQVLQEGDAVLFELGGVYNRYTAPLMRSAVIGQGDPEIRIMNDVCAEALQAAIDTLKPGVTSGQVDEACRLVIEKAGYEEMFRKRTGYAVGIGYPPSWNEGHIFDLKKDDQRILQAGMVFHMPPALRKPEKFGVGVSETVLVTETGCEVLTNFPRNLYLA